MQLTFNRSTVLSTKVLYDKLNRCGQACRPWCKPHSSTVGNQPVASLRAPVRSAWNFKRTDQLLSPVRSTSLWSRARCFTTVRAATTSTVALDLAPDMNASQPEGTAPAAETEACAASAYRVVNFYHLVDIVNPFQVIAKHKAWVADKDLCGRIYLSTQGINAQYSGLAGHAEGYAKWLEQQEQFKGLRWSSFEVDGHQFPKLRLKFKQNLISLAGGMTRLPITNPKARATPLAPHDWKTMLAQAHTVNAPLNAEAHLAAEVHDRHSHSGAQLRDENGERQSATAGAHLVAAGTQAATAGAPGLIVLDVRNDYEWDAGHFVGAGRPQEENFNQTPSEGGSSDSIPSYLQGANPDTPVMMYCTGGIRCDVYSAHLRDKGFNNLYTLEGGVQNYLRQEGHDMWDGSLFVFDGRMAVPSGNPAHGDELVAAAPCAACGQTATLPHMNCANIDCNKLFLACDQHKEEFAGCCCQECMEAPRLLRPAKQTGYYGNWTTYSSDDETNKLKLVEGRSDGRLTRRRKRVEKMRAKEAVLREQRHARKELVKVAMQNKQAALNASINVNNVEHLASKFQRQQLVT